MNDLELRAERRAKRFWVSLVVVLLALQLAIGFVAFRLATGDQSVAIVPDYHQAALDWDIVKNARYAAERKGWSLNLEASDVADGRGMRAVELRVFDAHRQGVDSLTVRGHVYHHALASQVLPIEFHSVGNGRYLSMAPMGRKGLWQIEVSIEGADEPMALTESIEAS